MIGLGLSVFNRKDNMGNIKEVKYLFIDAGNLDSILQRISNMFFAGDKLTIRYDVLAAGYDKVFYYDALPIKKSTENQEEFEKKYSEKESFLNELKLLDKYHVYEGVVFNRKDQLTQKAVDIMIAVDM